MSDAPILTPFLDDADVILYAGDCIDVMRRMPEASVDAIVTDPPYALNFMGNAWDSFSGNPVGTACDDCGNDDPVVGYRLCLDCLESADEAALRDSSMLGQVSQNWSKKETHSRGYADNNNQAFQRWTTLWAREAFRVLKPGGHLLAFAGTRTYHRMASGVEDAGFEIRDCIAWMYGSGFPKSKNVSLAIDKGEGHPNRGRAIPTASTYQATDPKRQNKLTSNPVDEYEAKSEAAQKWNGWGTALKPAYEPIVIARKPLTGTVAQNVLEHGTGALNIDACRIDMGDEYDPDKVQRQQRSDGAVKFASAGLIGSEIPTYKPGGRWPANVALDDAAASMLDEQSGDIATQRIDKPSQVQEGKGWSRTLENRGARGYTDNGGASRFFYTAKASRQDRNVGGLANNTHPTVKPTELMRWLIRLVTPPGGIILDPFGGSGSTGLAARAENVRCILIEREPEYLEIIRDRLAQLSLLSELLDDE